MGVFVGYSPLMNDSARINALYKEVSFDSNLKLNIHL
jgi:hypothetical protein